MRRILVWFRTDLRVHDHEALATAVRKADEVIPCYCFDPRQFGQTAYGFPKTGAFRAQFLVESVENLAAQIKQRGGKLLVSVGHPEEVIPRLAAEYRAEAVYAHKEVTDEETRVEDALEKQLWKQRIPIDFFWGHTLYHADDLPFPMRNLPEVFTDFRKQVERYVQVRPESPAPERIRVPELPSTPVPSVNDFGLPRPVSDERAVLTFVGGENEGLERLKYYLWDADLLRHYKETRNGLLGGDFSSKLAPWVAMGCVSPRRIYQEVKRYERERIKNDSTYWLVFELIWRDYFRFVARKYGNALFKTGGIRNKPVSEPAQLFDFELFERWRNGETGVPFVDANMVELRQTGFMSNRGRQNVASFLAKDLKADWRAGAAWFESQLLDYDPCSNYGNWNYVTGVGNDPREDRYFNVVKQAHQYDPHGEYVKHWLPVLSRIPAPQVHTPYLLSPSELAGYGVRLGENYPHPLVRPEVKSYA